MADVLVGISLSIAGILVWVVAVVALAVRREDRRNTLRSDAPDFPSRLGRRLNGVGLRNLEESVR
jgi:hypothetical protein